jgi:hypothetical protein
VLLEVEVECGGLAGKELLEDVLGDYALNQLDALCEVGDCGSVIEVDILEMRSRSSVRR